MSKLKQFNKKNYLLVFYTIILTFIVYGIKIFNVNYGMDTVQLMTDYPGTLRHWIAIGRPGMVLLKRLLFGGYTNVYLLNMLAFVCLCLTSLAICYLVYAVLGKNYPRKKIYIVPSLFITSQLFVYQYYFVLQNFEFSLMMGLVVLAVLLTFRAEKNLSGANLLAVSILLGALLVYQSFALYYVAIVSFVLLLNIYQQQMVAIQLRFIQLLKFSLPYILILLISLIGYFALNRAIQIHYQVPASSYLVDQSLWGKTSLHKLIPSLFGGLKMAILPLKGDLTYNYLLIVGLILLLITIIFQFIRGLGSKFCFLLTTGTLLLSSILMILVAGQLPNARTLVPVYPFVAVVAIFVSSLYFEYRVINLVFALLTIFFTWQQINLTTNLLYADQMRYEEDQRKIERINNQIDGLHLAHPENYKLMLVGIWPTQTTATLTSDMLGLSLFQFGQFTGNSYAATLNILDIMQTMGLHYQTVTYQEFLKLRPKADTMATFPAKNSLKVVGDTIIIKLY